MKTAPWAARLAALLIASTAGWMIFDGTRALVLGDYLTPATGEFAGQLGPWSELVQAIGIEPRSVLMKWLFIAQGLGTLTVVGGYLLGKPWARMGLPVAMLLGLWYLPVGTLVNGLAFLLLFVRRKSLASPPPPTHA